jgi:hypothetical protein
MVLAVEMKNGVTTAVPFFLNEDTVVGRHCPGSSSLHTPLCAVLWATACTCRARPCEGRIRPFAPQKRCGCAPALCDGAVQQNAVSTLVPRRVQQVAPLDASPACGDGCGAASQSGRRGSSACARPASSVCVCPVAGGLHRVARKPRGPGRWRMPPCSTGTRGFGSSQTTPRSGWVAPPWRVKGIPRSLASACTARRAACQVPGARCQVPGARCPASATGPIEPRQLHHETRDCP